MTSLASVCFALGGGPCRFSYNVCLRCRGVVSRAAWVTDGGVLFSCGEAELHNTVLSLFVAGIDTANTEVRSGCQVRATAI